MALDNTYNNWEEVEQAIGSQPGPGPEPGDYATKEYVDEKDLELSGRITTNTNNINQKQDKLTDEVQSGDLTGADTLSDVNLTSKKNKKWSLLKIWNFILSQFKSEVIATTLSVSSTNDDVPGAKLTFDELEKKVAKRTTGTEVYSHSDAEQGGLAVKTEVSTSPSDSNILTEKAIAALNKYSRISSNKIKLAGGFEIVFGNSTVSASGTQTINFSVAFTNACFAMIACPSQPGYGADAVLHARATSKSQFQVSQSGGVANMGFYYIAIGY